MTDYRRIIFKIPADVTTTLSNSTMSYIISSVEGSLTGPHPIHPLLPELLATIFEHACREHGFRPFILFLVSESWGYLAINTASLWTNMILDEEQPDSFRHAHTCILVSKRA